jgi:hypothetical protein
MTKRSILVAVFAAAAGVSSVSADAIDHVALPLKGSYLIYSGTLDDTQLPKANDAKVAIEINGPLAADMYRYLGPSAQVKDACVSEEVMRSKGDLICLRNTKTAVTICHVGLNIRTGKSINGVIC